MVAVALPQARDDVPDRVWLRFRRRKLLWKIAVAVVVFAVLAAIATATYEAFRSTAPPPEQSPGTLTFLAERANGPAEIVAAMTAGTTRVLWRCPRGLWCGDPTSLDWSPDRRHLAFTLDEIRGRNLYIGLHILDLKTGQDVHIPRPHAENPLKAVPGADFPPFLEQMERRLGCQMVRQVAWSPDGGSLAYGCANGVRGHTRWEIHIIKADGTGQHRVPINLPNVSWPSWSPDGKSLAFQGWRQIMYAETTVRTKPGIYTARLDGSDLRLIVPHGSTPDWTATAAGPEIAYQSPLGIKLVTPTGSPIRPRNARAATVAPPGIPAWSPDGQALAITTSQGAVYRVSRTGLGLRLVTKKSVLVTGPVRPAWYPTTNPPRWKPSARTTTHTAGNCEAC